MNLFQKENTTSVPFSVEQIIEAAYEGIWAIDSTGQTLFVNDRMAKMLGYKTKDLIGKSVYNYYFSPDDQRARERIGKNVAGETLEFTSRFKKKNGTLLLAIARTSPLKKPDGSVYGALGMFTDITEQSQIEAHLAQLASIVQSSEDAIYSLNATGHIQTWNAGATRLFGYTESEILQKKGFQFMPENFQTPDRLKKSIQLLKDGQFLPPIEAILQTKKRQPVYMSLTISKVKRGDDSIEGVSVIGRDITHKKRIESDHRKLIAELNDLIEIAPIGIAFIDSHQVCTKINKTLSDMLGKNVSEQRNQPIVDLFPSKCAKDISRHISAILKKRTIHQFELQPSDAHWWTVICYPIQLSEIRSGVGMIVQDNTDQKLIEKRKDDFLSMTSHELKTPLTTIKAFTQILNQGALDKPTTHKYLTKIDQQINRLTKLVNDLLDISKIRSGKIAITPEWFSFDNLLSETISSYQSTLTAHKIISRGKTHAQVFADRHRLSQVLTNLLSNAVKYSPDYDTVEVEVTANPKDIRVSVRDYGIGINPANQKRIFQSFYRVFDANAEFPGLGIGLFIASEIIKLHGGTIGVQSRLGAGSLFYFSLPYETKNSSS